MTNVAAAYEAGGIVRARTTATIASRFLAPVAEVHVRPGDRVARGARLVTLDARDLLASQTQAAASREAAASAAAAAEADVGAAEAAAGLARVTQQRIDALAGKRSATREELDRANADLAAAEARLAALRARLAASASARSAAEAAAEAAAVTLSHASLVAPFDGVVTARHVDPGSMAVPGTPLLVLDGTTGVEVEVHLDEARGAGVRVGQAVDVRVDAGFAEWRPAAVAEISRVDGSSHTFVVTVEVPGDADIRSGMFGRVRFAGRPRQALTVPSAAIVRRGQLTFVFALDGDLARLRSVRPGLESGGRAEVLAGLNDQAQVVLRPPDTMTDGTPVVVDTGLSGDAPR
jgi:multidrug efflux pump subunit AcrA (membrane-fusion protein)